eukprot:10803172-Alexandrium_andersonii.AAC.1
MNARLGFAGGAACPRAEHACAGRRVIGHDACGCVLGIYGDGAPWARARTHDPPQGWETARARVGGLRRCRPTLMRRPQP